MGREDDRRRRHRDERSRSGSRSGTRRPSTKSRVPEERSTRRDTDDRHYKTATAPQSSRRRRSTEKTYGDSEPRRQNRSPRAIDPPQQSMTEVISDNVNDGKRVIRGDLTLKNLTKLPGKAPETGKGSMAGSRRHEIEPVDCLEVKPKPGRKDSSGDTPTDRPRRIMPAKEEPITTLVHRPARRNSIESQEYSPERPKSSRKSHRQSEGDRPRTKGSRLPDDTPSSRRDHRSSKRRDESRSPTPPPTSLQVSSRPGHHGDLSLDLYNVGPPPPLVDPYRGSWPTNVPPGTYPPISRGGTNPMSARHYTDPSQLRALADQPYTQPYAGTYTGHGTRGAPRTTHGPNYTGVFAVDGTTYWSEMGVTKHWMAMDGRWYSCE